MKLRLLLTSAVLAISTQAHAAQLFTFSDDLPYGSGTTADTVSGSFTGDLDGNVITNLSNISVFFNGVAYAGNGNLYARSYDNGRWVGGAFASLDGSNNNFLFIDSDYPNNSAFTNYFYSITGYGDYAAAGLTNASSTYAYNGAVGVRITAAAAAVPEPASWAMMIAGFGAIGAALRQRRRLSVAFG